MTKIFYLNRDNPHVLEHVNFMPALLTIAFFVKTIKTASLLKSNDVTVTSINLADELVILLIFVNSEQFANAVTVGMVSHADKMRMQTLHRQGFGAI